MTTVPYVLFLVLGAALVVLDCHVLRRSARSYVAEIYPELPLADSIDNLLAFLLHFVGFGILALVSALDLGAGGALQNVVVHVGVLLVVLAAAHGVTIRSLVRLRDRQQEWELGEHLTQQTEERLRADGEKAETG
jgi:hypothetical protein